MICENKKIVIFFSAVIMIFVALLAIFDFGVRVRAFLGTVILGLIVFARSLINAEVVPPEVDLDTEDIDEEQGESTNDSANSESEVGSLNEQSDNQSHEQ